MFTIGQIVYSKSGRDKGLPFLVVSVSDEFAFLVDGDVRKLSSPKKKKFKHIQPTNNIVDSVFEKLENRSLLDANVKKIVAPFKRNVCKTVKEVSHIV